MIGDGIFMVIGFFVVCGVVEYFTREE